MQISRSWSLEEYVQLCTISRSWSLEEYVQLCTISSSWSLEEYVQLCTISKRKILWLFQAWKFSLQMPCFPGLPLTCAILQIFRCLGTWANIYKNLHLTSSSATTFRFFWLTKLFMEKACRSEAQTVLVCLLCKSRGDSVHHKHFFVKCGECIAFTKGFSYHNNYKQFITQLSIITLHISSLY